MNSERTLKYSLIAVPIFFLFYSAPSALDYIFFHADEKRYTDAVIFMMDKEDYFTPYQWDGETPRFKKPIVSYLVLMGGYKVFGISPFGSRFFFWLAGALLVAVSYLMSNSLFKNKKIAFLTAFIVASNPLVMMSASRSIPDILLVLFLTISAWGFLDIMMQEKPLRRYYWMAYLGAAMAFETKGVPAALFTSVSMLYLMLNPWKRIPPKKLFAPVPIVVSLLVAVSWFALMYIKYGPEFLDVFLADQLGERVSSRILQLLGNGALGVLNLFLYSIPWVFLFFIKPRLLRQNIKSIDTNSKAILGFIAIWVLLMVIMSASVFKFYDRYILPCIPLLSMFFAYFIGGEKIRLKRTVLTVFIALSLLIWLISLLYLVFISFNLVLLFGVIVESGLILLYYFGAFTKISREILVANTLMLMFFAIHTLLYPILMPVPSDQLSVALKKHIRNNQDRVYMYGSLSMSAKVRVQSHGELNIVSMDTVYVLPNDSSSLIAFTESDADLLDLSGYEIYLGSEALSGIQPDRFPHFMNDVVVDFKEKGEKYFIGVPK